MKWRKNGWFFLTFLVYSITFLIVGSVLFLIYVYHFLLREVGTEVSPNGRYRIVLQERGEPDWPYGEAHALATVYDGDRLLKVIEEDIADDGSYFTKRNYTIRWENEQVLISFHGHEQESVTRVVDLE